MKFSGFLMFCFLFAVAQPAHAQLFKNKENKETTTEKEGFWAKLTKEEPKEEIESKDELTLKERILGNKETQKELKGDHKDAKKEYRTFKKERKAAEAREKAAKARADAIKAERKATRAEKKAVKKDDKAERAREKYEEEESEGFLETIFGKQ